LSLYSCALLLNSEDAGRWQGWGDFFGVNTSSEDEDDLEEEDEDVADEDDIKADEEEAVEEDEEEEEKETVRRPAEVDIADKIAVHAIAAADPLVSFSLSL